jgi:hypothetical protein
MDGNVLLRLHVIANSSALNADATPHPLPTPPGEGVEVCGRVSLFYFLRYLIYVNL